MEGVIKTLTPDKGYGFIKDKEAGRDWFFHRSGLVWPIEFEELYEGDSVSFTPGNGPRGPRAENVERIG